MAEWLTCEQARAATIARLTTLRERIEDPALLASIYDLSAENGSVDEGCALHQLYDWCVECEADLTSGGGVDSDWWIVTSVEAHRALARMTRQHQVVGRERDRHMHARPLAAGLWRVLRALHAVRRAVDDGAIAQDRSERVRALGLAHAATALDSRRRTGWQAVSTSDPPASVNL